MTEKISNSQSSTNSLEMFGSKTVLVKTEKHKVDIPSSNKYNNKKIYNPHDHRILEHPNGYSGAFIHIVKASLGTGILAVPRAFKSSGLIVGAIGNIVIGILCTYTVNMLVQASQKASVQAKVPSLGFAETAEEVFKQGPKKIRKWSEIAKLFIELALVSTYYLAVTVYLVFMSKSLTKLFSFYYPETESWDKYVFKLMLVLLLLILVQIRELKYMVPFSLIANVMMIVAFGITGYYIFSGLDKVDSSTIKLANSVSGFPSFFSTVLFAMEGIGSIMPVENSMSTNNFLGNCGVLNSSMTIVVFLYTIMGILGYYRYGDAIDATITSNLPDDEILAQVAQGAIATSVFFTFMLQYYVPTNIVWNRLKERIPEKRHNISQILLRIIMLAVVTEIAILGGEDLGTLIEIVGAIFFSSLGFIVPAVLDIIVNSSTGFGKFYWILIKDILFIMLAIFGAVSGTYYALF